MMPQTEAAKRLAALVICSELIPVGCDNCPAYTEGLDEKQQRKKCNEILEPEKVKEAITTIKEKTGNE